MKKIAAAWLLLAAVLIGLVYLGRTGENRGVSAEELEQRARESQKIPENWEAARALSETAAVLLFYDPAPDYQGAGCTYSIWTTQPDGEGYFFRAGGSTTEVTRYIGKFHISVDGEEEYAYLSRNMPQAVRAEIDGDSVNMDPERPFALLLPCDTRVIFYDRLSEEIEPYTAREIII